LTLDVCGILNGTIFQSQYNQLLFVNNLPCKLMKKKELLGPVWNFVTKTILFYSEECRSLPWKNIRMAVNS